MRRGGPRDEFSASSAQNPLKIQETSFCSLQLTSTCNLRPRPISPPSSTFALGPRGCVRREGGGDAPHAISGWFASKILVFAFSSLLPPLPSAFPSPCGIPANPTTTWDSVPSRHSFSNLLLLQNASGTRHGHRHLCPGHLLFSLFNTSNILCTASTETSRR